MPGKGTSPRQVALPDAAATKERDSRRPAEQVFFAFRHLVLRCLGRSRYWVPYRPLYGPLKLAVMTSHRKDRICFGRRPGSLAIKGLQ